MNTFINVRETIHHGDYRNVREMKIPPTWDGFVSLMTSSPYSGGNTADNLARNAYAARTFADLISKGRAGRGWADYQVVETT